MTPDNDGPFVLSGSGFMMGTTPVFTLSESREHTSSSWRDSGVVHISLDKTTLNGTIYDIGHDYDKNAKVFDERYTAGTLQHTGGVIPLTSTLLEQQLLLLDK